MEQLKLKIKNKKQKTNDLIHKIINIIKNNRRFLIIAHDNLDGDSFGSGLALGLALKNMKKDVKFLIKNRAPKRYTFLSGIKTLVTKTIDLKKYRVLFVVDTAGWNQMDWLNPYSFRNFIIINIDHHIDNNRFGHINWINTEASAAGEMIYNVLKTLKAPITPSIATCLYTAILTDTGNFQFRNTTVDTHLISAELLQNGAPPSFVFEEIYERMPIARLRLLKYALGTLKTGYNKKIIWLWITQKMLQNSGADREDTEGFIDYIKAISGIKVAILFKEGIRKNEIRATFRSKDPKIFVNEIAHKFNGGGHPAAAGCTVYGTRKEVEKKVLRVVEDTIK